MREVYCLLLLAQGSLVLHYKLWSVTTQEVTDYSGNGNHGVNGICSCDTAEDAVITARGAYFPGTAKISAPPNDLVPTGFNLGKASSITIWALISNPDSNLFVRAWPNGELQIRIRYLTVSGRPVMRLRTGISATQTCQANGSGRLLTGSWTFLSARVDCTSRCYLLAYQNGVQVLAYNCPLFPYSDDPTSTTYFGGGTLGFIYEVKLYDHLVALADFQGEFDAPGTGGCSGVCSSVCVKDPAVQCLADCAFLTSTDSCSATCACSTSKCIGACGMQTSSCTLAGCSGTVYFDVDVVIAPSCHSTCLTCTGPSAAECTGCVDANADLVAGTCICMIGFYQDSECMPCDTTCGACTGGEATDCTSCKGLASLALGRCLCAPHTYAAPDATNCQLCSGYCAECTAAGPAGCSKCRDNAYLGGLAPAQCLCSAGFYLDTEDCVRCSAECMTCTSASVCSSCYPTAVYSAGRCICTTGFYLDFAGCVRCSAECVTCVSATECSSCSANVVLLEGHCICPTGFYGTAWDCRPCAQDCVQCIEFLCIKCRDGLLALADSCVQSCPRGYTANIDYFCEQGDMQAPVPTLFAQRNSLVVVFDKPMDVHLHAEDVSIEVTDGMGRIASVSWSDPVAADPQTLIINIALSGDWLPAGFHADLVFLYPAKVVDIYEMSVATETLTAALEPFGTVPTASKSTLQDGDTAQQAAALSQTSAAAGVVNSLLTGSSAPLLSIFNQMQLITYIAMSKLELSSDFAKTVAALNVQFVTYNPLQWVDPKGQSVPPQVENYGVDNSLFIANTVVFVGTAVAMVGSVGPVAILAKVKIEPIATHFAGVLKSYRWGAPINLWLTSYLDLCVFSLLQLTNPRASDWYIVLSVVLACCAVLLCATTPFLLLIFQYRRSRSILSQSDSEFNARWGALFQPFKVQRGVSLWFYPLFLLRRAVLAVTLTVLAEYRRVFAVANLALAGGALAFQVGCWPYSSNLANIESTSIELGTFATYLLASLSAWGLSDSSKEQVGKAGMWTVRIAIGLNVGFSSVKSIVAVRGLLKAYGERVKAVQVKYRIKSEANVTTSGRVEVAEA